MIYVKDGFCRRLIAEEPILRYFLDPGPALAKADRADNLVSWSVYRKHKCKPLVDYMNKIHHDKHQNA